jgi:hypothetical protein
MADARTARPPFTLVRSPPGERGFSMLTSLAAIPTDPASIFTLVLTAAVVGLVFVVGRGKKPGGDKKP